MNRFRQTRVAGSYLHECSRMSWRRFVRYGAYVVIGATALALNSPAAAHAQVDLGQIIRQSLLEAKQQAEQQAKRQAEEQQARGQNTDECDAYDGPALTQAMPHGRLADPRINHMTIGPYLCRWNLQPTDPTAASSEVVHPVTYLIEADIPAAWRPDIIRSVHAWDSAFDAIGLRHALTIREATPQDSLTPPANVVRIRRRNTYGTLMMSTACTAVRTTGQLTGCTIWVNGSAFEDAGRQMCRSTAVGDPAVPLSCPDSILAFLFRAMVTHEVGHSLGLAHNFHAGIAYPTDSLASARFVHDWGFAPSIMLNSQYTQYTPPEAHVPHTDRWVRIGPYDRWAIAWAYRPIPGATSAEAEQPTLERWRAAQDTAAYLRVAIEGPTGDLDLAGGDDPVRALEFRARDRVAVWQRWFQEDTAATLARVQRLDMPQQWQTDLTIMLDDVIGGRRPQPPYPRDRAAVRYAPFEPAQQLRAVRLALAYAVYGQDPYLHLITSISAHRPFQLPSPTDSVPFLFDTSARTSVPAATGWRKAQQNVLAKLVAVFPKLPQEAVPDACRYVAAAVSKLTSAKSAATSPSERAAATALLAPLDPAPVMCAKRR
jgi:hypothetical protein